MAVHPLIFEPIYKPKIWGGDRIFRYFNRPNPFSEPIGESWELADLEDDQSPVRTGPEAGRTLTHLVSDWRQDLLGHVELMDGRFPLLIKFLDARGSLSVQVHPTQDMAQRLGGNVRVKHEAWYVLAAEPGAVIYHGLEPGVDADRFRQAMLDGRIEGVLRRIEVRPGDCYYLPSGTTHALGAGVLVAEVQTPSDITYRTYDWGRIDPSTGAPRELHLEQAMECISFDEPAPAPMQERSHTASLATTISRLCRCPSFTIERVRMAQGTRQPIPYAEPVVWILLEGSGTVEWANGNNRMQFGKGNVVLLPAALADGVITIEQDAQWLEVTVPVGSDPANYDRPAKELMNPRPGAEPVQIKVPKTGNGA